LVTLVAKSKHRWQKENAARGLLPPIRANFKDAVKAFLGTPLVDDVKGSRAVNPKPKPPKKRKRARKKAR
jgi:hypothetical protein